MPRNLLLLPRSTDRKGPAVKWAQYNNGARPTEADYRRWKRLGILEYQWLMTGSQSEIIAADLDRKKRADGRRGPIPSGALALAMELFGEEELQSTACIRTQSGGYYYLFSVPPGTLVPTIKSVPGAPGFEIKGEKSGIAWPSGNGDRYQFVRGLECLRPCPKQALAQLQNGGLRHDAGGGDITSSKVSALSGKEKEGGDVAEAWERVHSGAETRHGGGLWLARRMRDQGIEMSEASQRILEYQRPLESIKPGDPYTASEAVDSLVWVYEHNQGIERNDFGNALRLVKWSGRDCLYTGRNGWYFWGSRYWDNKGAEEKVQEQCTRAIGRMYAELERIPLKEQVDLRKFITKSRNAAPVQGMMRMARPMLYFDMSNFDQNKDLFNLQNVTIDLSTGEARSHRREDYITRCAGTRYVPGARSRLWEDHLEMSLPDPEEQRFLQRFYASCMSGRNRSEAILLMVGEAQSGKGTIVETIAAVLGTDEIGYAGPAMHDLLLKKVVGASSAPLATLRGKRLVIAAETGDRLDEGILKELTGGGSITANPKYRDPITFEPEFKVVIHTNNLPTLLDTSGGSWRRIKVLNFQNPVSDRMRDDTWKERMKAPENRPGVLNWMLEGLEDWRENGLCPPESVQLATAEYRDAEDPVVDFVTEHCVLEEDACVLFADVYKLYEMRCFSRKEKPLHKNFFSTAIHRHGCRSVTRWRANKPAKWLIGIRLK